MHKVYQPFRARRLCVCMCKKKKLEWNERFHLTQLSRSEKPREWASEREKDRAHNSKKKKEKESGRKKVRHPEESISIWRRYKKKGPTSFSLILSLFLFCTSCMMVEQSWWDFFLLWHSSIELLRVLIRETRVAARQEDEEEKKDKMEREERKLVVA